MNRKRDFFFWFILGFVLCGLLLFIAWLTEGRISRGVDELLDEEQRIFEQRARGRR